MSCIDKLTFGEIKELMNLFGSKVSSLELPDPAGEKRIVILQRGWIVVGDVYLDQAEYRIENASVIRVWGTSKGLGEIAANGPTKETKLDPIPTVRVHSMAVVAQCKCESSKWK